MQNPLLDFSALPRYDAIGPEHVAPAIDTLVGEANATIERIATSDAPAAGDNPEHPR